MNITTTKLNNGMEVLAKPNGDAFHYVNRAQAAHKVVELMKAGIDAHHRMIPGGRVFYIVLDDDSLTSGVK